MKKKNIPALLFGLTFYISMLIEVPLYNEVKPLTVYDYYFISHDWKVVLSHIVFLACFGLFLKSMTGRIRNKKSNL